MRAKTAVAVLLLSLFTLALAAAAPPSLATDKLPDGARWVTIELFNVTPSTRLILRFDHGKFVGDVKLGKDVPEAVRGALLLKDGTLAFATSGKGIAAGFSRVAFAVPVRFEGKASGTLEAQEPLTAVLNAGDGAVTIQGGPFQLSTGPLPETCTLGCVNGAPCGKTPGADCYLYDNQYMCCLVCPTGC